MLALCSLCETIRAVHQKTTLFRSSNLLLQKNSLNDLKDASAGNRTRATRVAGENSTTEPPMLAVY